jgi:hypothetical protein
MVSNKTAPEAKFKLSRITKRNLIVAIITLIVGFSLGLCYAHFADSNSESNTSVNTVEHLCNCPMIPAHQDAADYCHC